jgi:CheY-like chemotaxis protein
MRLTSSPISPQNGIKTFEAASGLSLMLVDDKEISNFILRKNIEKHLGEEANIHEFCNASKAFSAIKSINPALIFLDLCLPNFEDGYGFLEDVRKLNLSTPIAILTSSIDEEHHALVEEHPNVISFISKPISAEELIQTITLAVA